MPLKSPINLGLPEFPTTDDPKLANELLPIYAAFRNMLIGVNSLTGAVQQDADVASQIPPEQSIITGNSHRLYVKAGVDLSYGHAVNLYALSGGIGARKAYSVRGSSGFYLPCHGFVTQNGGILNGNWGEVTIKEGLVSIAGLTIGRNYYISGTAGLISVGADPYGPINMGSPYATYYVVQHLGIAVAANLLYFNIALPYTSCRYVVSDGGNPPVITNYDLPPHAI